ncbi:hypothetical protein LCGC14_2591960, partial [marine sediment metagenome]
MIDTDVCTITSNTCVSNESNTANPQAGLYLDASCSENAILSNFLHSNINTGAGDGYGIYIGNANCENNVVRSNHISSNDINWKDIGTNTQIEYICSTVQDIQDAIDSIAAKSGTVILINKTYTLTGTINLNGGGLYTIRGEGEGSEIVCGGDRSAFYITSAKEGTTLSRFKIDATD